MYMYTTCMLCFGLNWSCRMRLSGNLNTLLIVFDAFVGSKFDLVYMYAEFRLCVFDKAHSSIPLHAHMNN